MNEEEYAGYLDDTVSNILLDKANNQRSLMNKDLNHLENVSLENPTSNKMDGKIQDHADWLYDDKPGTKEYKEDTKFLEGVHKTFAKHLDPSVYFDASDIEEKAKGQENSPKHKIHTLPELISNCNQLASQGKQQKAMHLIDSTQLNKKDNKRLNKIADKVFYPGLSSDELIITTKPHTYARNKNGVPAKLRPRDVYQITSMLGTPKMRKQAISKYHKAIDNDNVKPQNYGKFFTMHPKVAKAMNIYSGKQAKSYFSRDLNYLNKVFDQVKGVGPAGDMSVSRINADKKVSKIIQPNKAYTGEQIDHSRNELFNDSHRTPKINALGKKAMSQNLDAFDLKNNITRNMNKPVKQSHQNSFSSNIPKKSSQRHVNKLSHNHSSLARKEAFKRNQGRQR